MRFWLVLWTLVLIFGLGIFAALAVVVSIRGFADIRALFRSIESQHSQEEEDR